VTFLDSYKYFNYLNSLAGVGIDPDALPIKKPKKQAPGKVDVVTQDPQIRRIVKNIFRERNEYKKPETMDDVMRRSFWSIVANQNTHPMKKQHLPHSLPRSSSARFDESTQSIGRPSTAQSKHAFSYRPDTSDVMTRTLSKLNRNKERPSSRLFKVAFKTDRYGTLHGIARGVVSPRAEDGERDLAAERSKEALASPPQQKREEPTKPIELPSPKFFKDYPKADQPLEPKTKGDMRVRTGGEVQSILKRLDKAADIMTKAGQQSPKKVRIGVTTLANELYRHHRHLLTSVERHPYQMAS
jgi:hypothetical protein